MAYALTIDQGNTNTKVALWNRTRLLDECVIHQPEDIPSAVRSMIKIYHPECGIYCSVSHAVDEIFRISDETGCPIEFLSSETKTEINLTTGYTDPSRLGADRIAAMVGAREVFPTGKVLVIDMGTAITYDYIDQNNNFMGGNIAPGLRMRAQALNHYTAKLPKVDTFIPEDIDLRGAHFGHDTNSAIYWGVVEGVLAEILFYIKRMDIHNIVFTGGYSEPFFAHLYELSQHNLTVLLDPHLVSIGLNRILQQSHK